MDPSALWWEVGDTAEEAPELWCQGVDLQTGEERVGRGGWG